MTAFGWKAYKVQASKLAENILMAFMFVSLGIYVDDSQKTFLLMLKTILLIQRLAQLLVLSSLILNVSLPHPQIVKP